MSIICFKLKTTFCQLKIAFIKKIIAGYDQKQ